MEYVDVSYNNLSSLDVSNNINLSELYAHDIYSLTEIDVTNNIDLSILYAFNNQLASIDISNNTNLTKLRVQNNNISFANLKNGFNTNLTSLILTDNDELECVQVDDVVYAIENFTRIDDSNLYSSTCFDDQTIIISDVNFEQALIDLGYDTNGLNGTILKSEANSIVSLDISSPLTNPLLPNTMALIEDVSLINEMPNLLSFTADDNNITMLDLSNNLLLKELSVANNSITKLDVSNNTDLESLLINDNNLFSINLNNKNNEKLTTISLINNSNLTCAQVDDVDYAVNNFVNIDDSSAYSLDCFDASEIVLIPDTNFEQILIDSGFDTNGLNGNILGSDALKVDSLEVFSSMLGMEVSDLTGLESMKNLTSLYLGDTHFSTLDLSVVPSLQNLVISPFQSSQLTSIDISKNTELVNLSIYNGEDHCECGVLQYVDVSNNLKLETLRISNGELTSFDISNNTELKELILTNHQISNIDLTNNPLLTSIDLGNNQIQEIDLSSNSLLTSIKLGSNQLQEIDLSEKNDLTYVSLSNNQLDKVNLKNGNNVNFTFFRINSNADLLCVQVDDVDYAVANFTRIDDTSIYSSDCYDLTQTVLIPDANFEQALIDLGYDTNGLNGNILQSEAEAITILNVSNPLENELLPNVSSKIEDVTGIEAMTNLVILNAGENAIESIDVSNNTLLTKLLLDNNNISSIDVSMLVNLTDLHLYSNSFTAVNVEGNSELQYLYLANNTIESIDVSANTNLLHLYVANNNLSQVDVSNNTGLLHLYIANNTITEVDVTVNTKLEQLYAWENEITTLSVSNNTSLTQLLINDNNLESLTVKNGNNSLITDVDITGNSNLVCVTVDDVDKANEFWLLKDATTSYSNDCSIVFEVYTTDESFKTAIVNVVGVDVNEDGFVSYEEAQNFTGDLDLSNQNITEITGLEAFSNVANINLSGNNITDISDFLAADTVIISSKSTNIQKSVATTISKLSSLNVSDNLIESIDVSGITTITNLNVSNNKLTYLNVNNNANEMIISLDASLNEDLSCIQVDDADVSNNNENWIKDSIASYSASCKNTSLSIEDISENKFIISPNPVTDSFNIFLSSNVVLEKVIIFDLSGKEILKTDTEFINIQYLKAGVYILQIHTNKGVLINKLVKK